MLAGLFRSNQPAVLFVVPFVVAALLGATVLQPVTGEPAPMLLAAMVEGLLGSSAWPHHLLGLLLVVLIATQLVTLVNRHEMMDRRNHLVVLLFPLVYAGLSKGAVYHPSLLGMPLVLVALTRTWAMGNAGPVLPRLFDAGLLIGLAAMCYLPHAFFIVVVWASVSVIRPFSWREYLLPLVGFILVLYLAWATLHLMGRPAWNPLGTLAHAGLAGSMGDRAIAHLLFIVFGTMLLLASLAAFSKSYTRSVMRTKNLRSSFMAFALACAVVSTFVVVMRKSVPPVLLATPLSVLCSYGLLAPKRGWLAELGVMTMFLSALWWQWVG